MILYLIAGVLFGTIGGMGMGGGIILIPTLTLLLDTPQHTAQAMNLAAFLPMSIFALITHIRHKRVDIRIALIMAAFGAAGAVFGALAANILDAAVLKKCFGGFLILLAAIRIYKQIKQKKR